MKIFSTVWKRSCLSPGSDRTKKLAFATEIYKESDAPLATSLEFVINRFWFRLHKGGELVRDFIPVRFTNDDRFTEGALYDRVSGEFFTNQGTGSFIIGPDL